MGIEDTPRPEAPKDIKTVAEIARELQRQNTSELPDIYVLVRADSSIIEQPAGEKETSLIFTFRMAPRYSEGSEAPTHRVFEAYMHGDSRDDYEMRGAFYLDELVKTVDENDAAGFIAVKALPKDIFKKITGAVERDPATVPPTDRVTESTVVEQELTGKELRAREITLSSAEYLRATTALLETRAFQRIQHGEFMKTNIIEAIQAFESHEHERKASRGVTLSRGKASFRGENVLGRPENPEHIVKTLVICTWLTTEPMARGQMVAGFEGRKNRIAGIRGELERIKAGAPTELGDILRKEGYEQVRLEVGSWRTRIGELYSLHIPLMGLDLRRPESK